jgi:ABC-type dipeptide/oligopeptide/nickel transport system permease component
LNKLANSALLAAAAFLFTVPFSLLGIIAGLNKNRWSDNVILVAAHARVAQPEFVPMPATQAGETASPSSLEV